MTDAAALKQALAAAAAEGLEANARRWCKFVGWAPGRFVELAALKVPSPGGKEVSLWAHAAGPDDCVRLLGAIEGARAQAIYVIANMVPPELVTARESDGATPAGDWWLSERGSSTTDKDVHHRDVVFVDGDVPRPTGTSATEEELALASEGAAALYDGLVAVVGADAVAVGCSGNGYATFLALDHLAETQELHALVARVLACVKRLYERPTFKVDAHLVDPKRLVPAFGTTKRKGAANDPARPHRRTSILVPERVRRLSLADLQRLLAVLQAKLPPVPATLPRPRADTPEESPAPEDSLEIADLRKRLVSQRRRKAGSTDENDVERYQILTAVIDGTALALPGTAAGDGTVPVGRSVAVNKAAWLLARALPAGLDWEVVVELLRPAVCAMDCEPEGVEHWLGVAEHSYGKAMLVALEADAERKEREASESFVKAALADIAGTSGVTEETFTPAVAAAVTAASTSDADAWATLLATPGFLIRSADKRVKDCGENARVFMMYHPDTRGKIRFNEVTKDVEVHGGPLGGAAPAVLGTSSMNWLLRVAKISLGRTQVEDQLLLVAYDNHYDPIRDYLLSVVWDGTPRIRRFFFDYARAMTESAEGKDITRHVENVAHVLFVSAAARGLDPGCQVDTVPVLEGLEGIRKTSLLRVLGGKYATETQLVLGDKDTQMVAARSWIIELAELASLRRSDDDATKAFITRRKDTFRPPFGRVVEDFPRRAIFVATTNDHDYLSTGKGKRRWLPVHLISIDLEAVERDRDQLWAEAVARYRGYVDAAGVQHPPERWHLEGGDRDLADEEAGTRLEPSVVEEKVASWWYSMGPTKRRDKVTALDVAEVVLQLPVDRVTKGLRAEIGHAMDRLGFKKTRAVVGGHKTYVWTPTADMQSAPAHTPLPKPGNEDAEALSELARELEKR